MSLDLTLYKKVLDIENSGTKDYYIEQQKQLILNSFTNHPSYQLVTIDDVETDTHLIRADKLKENPNKKLLLSKPNETFTIGSYIVWNTKNWVIYDIDDNQDIQDRALIYKCNTLLKWYNEDGVLVERYAANYNVRELGFDEDKQMTTLDGRYIIILPHDSETEKLNEGQRFVISNRFIYKLSFIEAEQNDLIYTWNFKKYEVNTDIDNLTLGIADYVTRPTFTLSISEEDLSLISGITSQLTSIVKDKDDIIVDKDITWSSSDETIATVDSTGLVTTILEGSVDITATMTNNGDVSDSINIQVVSVVSDNYEIVLDPNIDILRIDDEKTINVKLLNNGVDTTDAFVFTVLGSSTAESDEYIYTLIDDNNFKLKCEGYGHNVVIRCQSGTNIKDKTITLKYLY